MTTPLASLLSQAAAAAAGAQQYPPGSLYVVATPIGNLADMTLRAIHVLGLVDAVACEDTRHTAPLLRHLGLDKPLLALHQHNEHQAAAGVVARLQRGERIAYVSDAGTPGISDPGSVLVAAVQAAGLNAVPVPGASSAVAAVSVAGDLLPGGFCFEGFLPTRASERAQRLQQLLQRSEAQVLFEAPHRIAALASQLAEAAGERRVTLARELTKQFETVVSLPASALPAWLAADPNRSRGEFVLVVHARAAEVVGPDEDQRVLRTLLAALPLKQAVALAAELTGTARNSLYSQALLLKREAEADDGDNSPVDGAQDPA